MLICVNTHQRYAHQFQTERGSKTQRHRDRQRHEREKCRSVFSSMYHHGTQTQLHTLTGDQTHNLLVHGMLLHPHTRVACLFLCSTFTSSSVQSLAHIVFLRIAKVLKFYISFIKQVHMLIEILLSIKIQYISLNHIWHLLLKQ